MTCLKYVTLVSLALRIQHEFFSHCTRNTKQTLYLKFLALGHLERQMLPLWCFPHVTAGHPCPLLQPAPAGAGKDGFSIKPSTDRRSCHPAHYLHTEMLWNSDPSSNCSVFSQSSWCPKLVTNHLSWAYAVGNSTRWERIWIRIVIHCVWVELWVVSLCFGLICSFWWQRVIPVWVVKMVKWVTEIVRTDYIIVFKTSPAAPVNTGMMNDFKYDLRWSQCHLRLTCKTIKI